MKISASHTVLMLIFPMTRPPAADPAAPAADENDVRALQRIVRDQFVKRHTQPLRGAVEDRMRERVRVQPERCAGNLARTPGSGGIAMRERVVGYHAENVRGARRRLLGMSRSGGHDPPAASRPVCSHLVA